MENIKNIKKQNFFKKVYNSITNFESYKEFYLEVISKPIVYLIKLSLILSLIVSIFFVYKLSEEIKNILVNELPNFEYKNGILNFEDTVNIEQEDNLFIIDTSLESDEAINKYKETIGLYGNVAVFLKNKAIYKAEGMQEITIPYSEIYQKTFSKDYLLDLLNGNKKIKTYFVFCLAILPIMFIGYLIKFIIYILILSVFGIFSSYILRMELKYSNIFNICVYGYTLSFVLEIVFYIIQLFTDFHIYRSNLMSILIAFVYLITALRLIKNDFIKRQEEYDELNVS